MSKKPIKSPTAAAIRYLTCKIDPKEDRWPPVDWQDCQTVRGKDLVVRIHSSCYKAESTRDSAQDYYWQCSGTPCRYQCPRHAEKDKVDYGQCWCFVFTRGIGRINGLTYMRWPLIISIYGKDPVGRVQESPRRDWGRDKANANGATVGLDIIKHFVLVIVSVSVELTNNRVLKSETLKTNLWPVWKSVSWQSTCQSVWHILFPKLQMSSSFRLPCDPERRPFHHFVRPSEAHRQTRPAHPRDLPSQY